MKWMRNGCRYIRIIDKQIEERSKVRYPIMLEAVFGLFSSRDARERWVVVQPRGQRMWRLFSFNGRVEGIQFEGKNLDPDVLVMQAMLS